MTSPYRHGDRVETPSGPGTVGYVRWFAGRVEAVSVVLDANRHRPGYAGSIFPVERVSAAQEEV